MPPTKTRSFTDHIDKIERNLLQVAKNIDGNIAAQKRAYLGTNNKVLGLTVPQQKQLLKCGHGFADLSMDEQLLIWNAVLQKAKHHESKMQALHWLADIKDTQLLLDFWPVISNWVKFIDSWDTSDNLSSVFVRLLEKFPNKIYPQLKKWNASKNPWERRQSIVSLLYYSNARKIVLPANKILSLVENLIGDEDKFVQKGVGWTLRECHSVHPTATKQFIRQYATLISATAFSAAAEKWPPAFLNEIKTQRKKHRQYR